MLIVIAAGAEDGIDIAATAPICPIRPMPNATSKARARRWSRDTLMPNQLAPDEGQFKRPYRSVPSTAAISRELTVSVPKSYE